MVSGKSITISAPYLPENVEQDGENGREVEIIKAVVSCMGYSAKIEVSPYLRHLKVFSENKRFDAVSTVPIDHVIKAFKAKSHVCYHNGANIRIEANTGLKTKEDLKDKHVIAFRGANQLLAGLNNLIPNFKSYKETTEQFNHNKMLMKKRVDVVLSDGLIFMAHQRRLFPNQIEEVLFLPIFKPMPFYMAFRDSKLTDSFNKCFEKLTQQKVIKKINESFINKYKRSLGSGYLRP